MNKEKLSEALPMFLVNASTCQFHTECGALLNTFFGLFFLFVVGSFICLYIKMISAQHSSNNGKNWQKLSTKKSS